MSTYSIQGADKWETLTWAFNSSANPRWIYLKISGHCVDGSVTAAVIAMGRSVPDAAQSVVVTNNSLAHNVSLIATLPFYVSHESKCVQLSSSLGYQGFEQMWILVFILEHGFLIPFICRYTQWSWLLIFLQNLCTNVKYTLQGS